MSVLSPHDYRRVRRIESERRRIELAGTRVAAKIGRIAFRHAAHALRLGHDPVQAAKDVLLGNDRIGQPGIAPVLTRMMLVSRLQGHRRSVLEAQPHSKAITSLSRDAEKLKRDQRRLMLLLLLDDDDVAEMERQIVPVARKLTQQAVQPLLNRMAATAQAASGELAPVIVGTLESPVRLPARLPGPSPLTIPLPAAAPSIPTTIKELGDDFAKSGMIPGNAHGLANVFETANVKQYEEGRFDGWDEPAVKETLWGFRYSAVLDNRTTILCRTLDGTIAPMDDPFWARFTPPNHWNCRSVVIEVWKSSALSKPDVMQGRATPEQIDDFLRMKRDFLRDF